MKIAISQIFFVILFSIFLSFFWIVIKDFFILCVSALSDSYTKNSNSAVIIMSRTLNSSE